MDVVTNHKHVSVYSCVCAYRMKCVRTITITTSWSVFVFDRGHSLHLAHSLLWRKHHGYHSHTTTSLIKATQHARCKVLCFLLGVSASHTKGGLITVTLQRVWPCPGQSLIIYKSQSLKRPDTDCLCSSSPGHYSIVPVRLTGPSGWLMDGVT